MFSVINFFKRLSGRPQARQHAATCFNRKYKRNFSDTTRADTESKQVAVQGPENEERVRVRRARAADVPRVLRFVREHARSAWPGLAPPPSASHIVLCDYVARALAQGHSMLAEQQEAKCGWGKIRGLALNTLLCPWDTVMLERWARCVRCARSRHLINFTAHCLRAPALHDKYRVHNILQVTLIIPLDTPKTTEIINMLAKNSIERGREMGFPLIRFDVNNSEIAKTLEQLELKKEWQMAYESIPDKVTDKKSTEETNKNMAWQMAFESIPGKVTDKKSTEETNKNLAFGIRSSKTEDPKISKIDNLPANFVAVYTSHISSNKE